MVLKGLLRAKGLAHAKESVSVKALQRLVERKVGTHRED
jgi:hypothetical protein